jgi:hypothetical protein
VKGSTLSFKKESAAFAKALQAEHGALGELLELLREPARASEGFMDSEVVKTAQKAHEAVRFQRTRTEAARGQ